MSDDLTDIKHHEDSAIVKSTHKPNLISKIRNKIPQVSKRTLVLLLIMSAIPVTVALSQVQQELRSRASIAGDGKVFLGIANATNNNYTIENIDSDLEKIKTETGAYPSTYAVWANMDVDKARTLAIFNHLDSKGISPALYLMPVSNVDMERRDGRFLLASPSVEGGVSEGEIRFDSATPSQITKIYVSKAANGTENPNRYLAPSWLKGEVIEIFGSLPNENINYEGSKSFKFEIIEDIVNGPSPGPGYWVLSVKPLKTTPLTGLFASGKAVFISPTNVLAKKYTNANIARGSLDPGFTAYAEIIRDYGKPVLFRYAQEMNGDWFHWSAGSRKGKVDNVTNKDTGVVIKGYGRKRFFPTDNTADNFVKSWKHTYDLMKPIAPKTMFYWCGAGSHDIGGYFPGEEYVDFVGFDVYSGINNAQHGALSAKIPNYISNINTVSRNKKIIIGEIGIDTTPKSVSDFSKYRKDWLREGYEYIKNNHPRIIGIMYFNVDMRGQGEAANNWLLWDSPEIASVYRALLLDPRFQGKFGKSEPTKSPTPKLTSVPSSTPIPTPLPPGSGSDLPYGFHDSASCTVITGWACDENNYNNSVNVELYNGPKSDGQSLGVVRADKPREAGVASECGGVSNHGFSIATPESLKDGGSHRIYAYAVDLSDPSSNSRLSSSPKVVSCAGAAPTSVPPPPDPTDCVRTLPTISYQDAAKSGKRKEKVTYKITIKNNDSTGCIKRKIAFDLSTPTTRWVSSPEVVEVNSGETKIVDYSVTSGPYSSFGLKVLDLKISGVYKPYTVFSTKTLIYNVVQ